MTESLDEPATVGGDDPAALLSELDSHDLSFATDAVDPADPSVFEADADDPDAPRELLVAYRIPEGEVRLEEVTDEYR